MNNIDFNLEGLERDSELSPEAQNKISELLDQILAAERAIKAEVVAYVAMINSQPENLRDHQRRVLSRVVPFLTQKNLKLMERYAEGKISWEKYWGDKEVGWFHTQRSYLENFQRDFTPFYQDALLAIEKDGV